MYTVSSGVSAYFIELASSATCSCIFPRDGWSLCRGSFIRSVVPRQRIRQRKKTGDACNKSRRPQCNNGPHSSAQSTCEGTRFQFLDWDEMRGRRKEKRKLHWTCSQPASQPTTLLLFPPLISEFCSLHQFLIDYDQTWGNSAAQTSFCSLKNRK